MSCLCLLALPLTTTTDSSEIDQEMPCIELSNIHNEEQFNKVLNETYGRTDIVKREVLNADNSKELMDTAESSNIFCPKFKVKRITTKN